MTPLRAATGHLLECQEGLLGGIRFLGATLWTDFAGGRHAAACVRGMSDFSVIADGSHVVRPEAVRYRADREFSGDDAFTITLVARKRGETALSTVRVDVLVR